MAGPSLPVNIDTTYADDAGDASQKTHQQHHDLLHLVANLLDTANVATSGFVPVGNGTALVTRVLTSADISGFAESVDDRTAALLTAGTAITVTYNDGANTLTIATTATVNATDAQLRDRSTHTGTQAPSTITGFSTATVGFVPVGDGSTLTTRALLSTDQPSVVVNTQTASYTLVLADAGKLVEMNVASANTLTVPPNSSVAFPVGTVVVVRQYGAGVTTVTAGAGVAIRCRGVASSTSIPLAGAYAEGTLTKRATDEWVLAGDVTAV